MDSFGRYFVLSMTAGSNWKFPPISGITFLTLLNVCLVLFILLGLKKSTPVSEW